MPVSKELNIALQPHNSTNENPAVLLVDQAPVCLSLRGLLESEGFQVTEVTNASEILPYFNQTKPDIVFIDYEISASDNHESISVMLAEEKHRFLPIIFLSAHSDEQAYTTCIDLGGHDYLTKPVSKNLLKAKLHLIERIRKIHTEAQRLHDQVRMEQELAETVFNGAVIADNLKLDCLNTIIKPAEAFNGDVLLSAHAPSNDLYILLGDFTGHGLAAALGALPAAEVFRAMTAKGFSPHQIVAAINQKLHGLLPTGMFFAIQFVVINHDLDYIKVINCGMPDILLLDGQSGAIKQRFNSRFHPLGIVAEAEFHDLFSRAKIIPGDRILLVSDGVTEARNSRNENFGKMRLEQAVQNRQNGDSVLDSILNALDTFCQDTPQTDDISLADIPCIAEVLPQWSQSGEVFSGSTPQDSEQIGRAELPASNEFSQVPLEFSLTLPGNRLGNTDPIPLLINHLQEMEGLHKHRRLLFTLLSELYVNALDHGLLHLDSKLKNSAEGFSEYFMEREKRLQNLQTGSIYFRVQAYHTDQGGKIKIRIEDSGTGFDLSVLSDYLKTDPDHPSGRGIQLLHSLCESVRYEEPGNKAEVVFSWTS